MYNVDIYNENYTIKEFYLKVPGDTKPNATVKQYLNEILGKLQNGTNKNLYIDLFDGLTIATYNSGRYEFYDALKYDGGIAAGLTFSDKNLITINGDYAKYPGIYSHELGHYYNFKFKNGSKIGEQLWQFYKDIRSQDFNLNTPEYECFAEDFKFFYGSNEVVGKIDPNHNLKRKPNEINNYWLFLKSLYPVAKRLADGSYQNIKMIDNVLMWQRNNVWECFSGSGNFYYWNGSWNLY